MEDKKIMALIYGAIMATLGAFVTAMLSSEPNIWKRVKTFLAGVACGMMLHMIFLNFDMSQGWKDVIATASACFVSTVWPELQNFYLKYLKKKSNDLTTISDNKPD